MLTRSNILGEAVDKCMKELYSYAQPHIEWNEFVKENKIYSDKYKAWERYNHLSKLESKNKEELKEYSCYPSNWKGKSLVECIGPRPYEFYYLPKDILKDIVDNYVYVYKIDEQQNLLDIIEILKNYCKEPIVDKWIEGENELDPGHRGYDHPDNLEKQLIDLIPDSGFDRSAIAESVQSKFFEFLDMAGNFYNWNRDLNSFNMSVYMGPSPYSNKETVIKNWKEYRGEDIEINEEQIKKDYYGEELD